MLRSLLSKAQGLKDFWKPSKPCDQYSLDSSRRVLSDEYPFARVSVILQVFYSILYWPPAAYIYGLIYDMMHDGDALNGEEK